MQPQFIEFTQAQALLTEYLGQKLIGETSSAKLAAQAQRLAVRWFARQPPVLMGTSGIRIIGCTMHCELGVVKVSQWSTDFAQDPFRVSEFTPNAICLGMLNGAQLYIADVEGFPNLVARNSVGVTRWSAKEAVIPARGTPLFMALERARALGYLEHLKGTK